MGERGVILPEQHPPLLGVGGVFTAPEFAARQQAALGDATRAVAARRLRGLLDSGELAKLAVETYLDSMRKSERGSQ